MFSWMQQLWEIIHTTCISITKSTTPHTDPIMVANRRNFQPKVQVYSAGENPCWEKLWTLRKCGLYLICLYYRVLGIHKSEPPHIGQDYALIVAFFASSFNLVHSLNCSGSHYIELGCMRWWTGFWHPQPYVPQWAWYNSNFFYNFS
jgi:hypothetical protein